MRFTARSPMRLLIGVSTLALAGIPVPALAQDAPETATAGEAGDSQTAAPAETANEVASDEAIVVTGIRASLAEVDEHQAQRAGRRRCDLGRRHRQVPRHQPRRIASAHHRRVDRPREWRRLEGHGPRLRPRIQPGAPQRPPDAGLVARRLLQRAGVALASTSPTSRPKASPRSRSTSPAARRCRPAASARSSTSAPRARSTARASQGSIARQGRARHSRDEGDRRSRRNFPASSARPLPTTRSASCSRGSYQRRKASIEPVQRRLARRLSRDGEQLGLARDARRSALRQHRQSARADRHLPSPAERGLRLQRHRPQAHQRPGVLQFQPTDALTGTFDYTFSQNTVEARNSSIGVWFNHGDTSSAWTDGPVAGPNFYSEAFRRREARTSPITGAVDAPTAASTIRSAATSPGTGRAGCDCELDAHHSTAESKPTIALRQQYRRRQRDLRRAIQTRRFHHRHAGHLGQHVPGHRRSIAATSAPPATRSATPICKDRINEVPLQGRLRLRHARSSTASISA